MQRVISIRINPKLNNSSYIEGTGNLLTMSDKNLANRENYFWWGRTNGLQLRQNHGIGEKITHSSWSHKVTSIRPYDPFFSLRIAYCFAPSTASRASLVMRSQSPASSASAGTSQEPPMHSTLFSAR